MNESWTGPPKVSRTGRAAPSDAARDFAALARAERLARVMDSAVRLPGVGVRVGLDSVVGLLPAIGDTLTLLPAAYILATARRTGAPATLQGRMLLNVGIDWLIGLVPLAGDVADVGFKSNSRNAALLRRHLERVHGSVDRPG